MEKDSGMRRRTVTRGLTAIAVTAGLVIGVPGLAAGAPPAPAPAPGAPTPGAKPAPNALPAPAAVNPVPGVSITKTFWYSDRRVALWVHSPAMGADIHVQLLLARDWNSNPTAKFPVLYMLDGLRAQDNENGWTINTNAENFYKDKNVNVMLPVGGQSSFYTDWEKPDNGKHYMWETFLMKELPPVLENQWRSTNVLGIEGLSMGGSSAMMLAGRNPGFFRFAGSFSGILQLSSFGMPQAVQFAMNDAGGYDSGKMFGPPSDPNWAAHDPYLLAPKLRGTSLYISSGNGLLGQYDTPSTIPGLATNYAGVGLEVLARTTTQQFATKLNQIGVPAQAVFRPSGTHTWPYWQFEMSQAWPQAAAALGLSADRPKCGVGGAIAPVAKAHPELAECLTPEYSVPGGIAQDFRGGRVIWSPGTGAHVVGGAIGGAYVQAGGPGGSLGFPTSNELVTPDGKGRFNRFQKGNIYWTAFGGAHEVAGAILAAWGRQGYERGPLGYPLGDEISTPNGKGKVQGFQNGAYYWNAADGAHGVQGAIFKKFGAIGYEGSWLGFPTSDEISLARGGKLTRFDGGNIYWTPQRGAFAIPAGAIFDAWGRTGYENGKLGYPISDQFQTSGGYQVNFENGTLQAINGGVTGTGAGAQIPAAAPAPAPAAPVPAAPAPASAPSAQVPAQVPAPAASLPAQVPAPAASEAVPPTAPAPAPGASAPAPAEMGPAEG